MIHNARWFALLLMLGAPSWVAAEQVRYHYVPTDACGTMAAVPAGPEGTLGELRRGLGVIPLPYPYAVRPTRMVTFRHPYTGRNVTVPMRLPLDQASMEHRADRIVYTYNDYTV